MTSLNNPERIGSQVVRTQRAGADNLGMRYKDSPKEEDSDKVLVTVGEAARRLSLSRTYTYALVMSGELESLTFGKARRVPVKALDEFVEARRAARGY